MVSNIIFLEVINYVYHFKLFLLAYD